jgi:PPK2 family polyphosphate:nucleotide phosphotransferase
VKRLSTKDAAVLSRRYLVEPGTAARLADRDTGDTFGLAKPPDAKGLLRETTEVLAEYQRRLAAQDADSLLVVLQAMDAAGKDGAIAHVMSGVNPQGVRVTSFKAPAGVELDHDYLWRHVLALPERGMIGIFNRSYYEEVLVVRVHPEILDGRTLPARLKDAGIWERRFREISDFERYLVDNGHHLVKIFLHVSKDEQRKRFLDRIEEPDKNWKFQAADVRERAFWDDYMRAYEDAITRTSTTWAPWHVVPADHKWFARIAVAGIIGDKLREIDPRYPTVTAEQKAALRAAEAELRAEGRDRSG